MNTTLKLVIVSGGLLLASCNGSNQDVQSAQTTQPATNNTPHIDTFKHKPAGVALVDNGMNVIKYDNGKVKMQGNSKNGSRDGEWKSFFPDGQLQSDEFFTAGKPDGKVTVYYENGKKMYEGENNNGELKGVWTYWDDKGKVTRTIDYSKQPVTHH
ncbi:MAG TPA: hypothetical protein VK783_05215 [Bacteroidia bacterium]|nr:hypothetical protein [Bacteroidia bacterium]